ncbi:hypothetical protein J2S49_001321 [Arcanobacterium wilhelmae]|nr:hypothetical protein [Arcanobacterium wilhelmae]MDP9800437.1 hypothetical protein [Arcanobacterium wilhelmae]MDP9800589.1 hypothetical protein [Arcanobacterium wilhelmae]MDP9800844.1 hypothetical protein [Arcanobacterium wilhelmae]MDP9801029.1 hypothetical protein [Arcanobacterium wilhelmae]
MHYLIGVCWYGREVALCEACGVGVYSGWGERVESFSPVGNVTGNDPQVVS